MISSSIQATLAGRFGTSEYGKSKKAGEELMFQYGEDTGAKVLVYRFPNLYGKWCRPNYNSAVATFCNNIANDLPITVNDPTVDMDPSRQARRNRWPALQVSRYASDPHDSWNAGWFIRKTPLQHLS